MLFVAGQRNPCTGGFIKIRGIPKSLVSIWPPFRPTQPDRAPPKPTQILVLGFRPVEGVASHRGLEGRTPYLPVRQELLAGPARERRLASGQATSPSQATQPNQPTDRPTEKASKQERQSVGSSFGHAQPAKSPTNQGTHPLTTQ